MTRALVYVDTSALLPLLDRADPDHARVVACLTALRDEASALITTSYVVVECSAIVRRRLGTRAHRALAQALGAFEHLEHVDADLHARAWAEMSKGGRKGPSLVDWSGFLCMRDHGVDTALAIDRHFRAQGFTVIPEVGMARARH